MSGLRYRNTRKRIHGGRFRKVQHPLRLPAWERAVQEFERYGPLLLAYQRMNRDEREAAISG